MFDNGQYFQKVVYMYIIDEWLTYSMLNAAVL